MNVSEFSSFYSNFLQADAVGISMAMDCYSLETLDEMWSCASYRLSVPVYANETENLHALMSAIERTIDGRTATR